MAAILQKLPTIYPESKAMNNPLDTLQSIRERRTIKIMSDVPLPTKPCDAKLIETLIESAYYAPYHYPCSSSHQEHMASALPWRFYVLDSSACRQLASVLTRENIPANKPIGMLNTADYLIQATWCPQASRSESADEDILFDGNLINMEHLAAAGAAIQNLLVSATSLGLENYWGSGGPLRQKRFFDKLGIPNEEILLGALFIFPSEDEVGEEVSIATSNRREKRGELAESYRFVVADDIE